MKFTATAHIYPYILKGVVSDQLLKHFNKAKVKEILKSTTKEYKSIVNRAPDIGGSKNFFLSSYLLGGYIIALYKNIKEYITLSELDEIIADGLTNFKFMKKQMQKQDLLSKDYKNKMEEAAEWCAENKDKYPTNWLLSIQDKEKVDETHIVFTRCGLCTLCKNEGVPELISSLCATDYITMSFANCNLIRRTTLGAGDECCDFLITKK